MLFDWPAFPWLLYKNLSGLLKQVFYRLDGRMAINLENLEYSGISLNMEKPGNSQGYVQPQGKIVTKYFSLSFRYLCKTAVDWVKRIIRNRDEVRVWW